MGSLMAGWNSRVLDPKSVKYKRNRSLTKEEIEAYWKSQKKKSDEERDRLNDVSIKSTDDHHRFVAHNVVGKDFKRSSTFPPAKEIFSENRVERRNLEKMDKSGWWMRSNSAFLNEPPILDGGTRTYASHDGTSRTYASQFDVANVASSELKHSDYVGVLQGK